MGVVSDIRFDGYGASGPAVYLALAQHPLPEVQVGVTGASARGLRDMLAAADPGLMVWGVQSLRDQLAARLQRPRMAAVNVAIYAFMATLVCLAGVIALTLLMLGTGRRALAIRASLGGRPLNLAMGAVGRLCVACGYGAVTGAAVAAIVFRGAQPGVTAAMQTLIGAAVVVGLTCLVAALCLGIAYGHAKSSNLSALLKA